MDSGRWAETEFLEEFAAAMSQDRFGTYLRAVQGEGPAALRLYAWNVEISAAFWIEFHVLEVALRNACHDRLTLMTGTEEWWNGEIVFHRGSADALRRARNQVADRRTGSTPGHVVAELGLGFWTGLFASRYHQRLWVDGLELSVPGAKGQRSSVHRPLERLRKLRNRVAHHEPIFARDLADDHRAVHQIVEWINPVLAEWLVDISRVPESLRARPSSGEVLTRDVPP